MVNKIKDIFSDNMYNVNGTLRFSDEEAYKNFLSALEITHAEGRIVPVEGVVSVDKTIEHLGAKFPLEQHTNIIRSFVGPAVKPMSFKFDACGEEKSITLLYSRIEDKVILISEPEAIITFNFTFLLSENRHTLNYKVQFDKAQNIAEIADSFSLAKAFLAYFDRQEDNESGEYGKVSLADIKEYFRCYEAFFRRLQTVENEFGLSISPILLNNLSHEEQRNIDEVYLTLCKRKVVRLNTKVTSIDSTSITVKQANKMFNIGEQIVLTFVDSIEFNFLEQKVSLYTANLVVNAVVKDVQAVPDGTTKILYGDTDSKPMYISYSGFKTEEKAIQESNCILQHDKDYINALTVDEYIKHFYSNKK